MKASTLYSAEPIKLDTFNDSVTKIVGAISTVVSKTFDTGTKLVATLDDDWSLVINATNFRVIRAAYGDETDEWIGRPLEVYKGTVHYQGREQPGVCVRIPPEDPEETVTAAELTGPKAGGAKGDDFKDDIPF